MIKAIVAVDEHWGFSKDGKIPWHFPNDFKHFKETTKQSHVIMGRKTFEDILSYKKNKDGPILPDRLSVILTSRGTNNNVPVFDVDRDACFVSSLTMATTSLPPKWCDRWLIGGLEVFDAAVTGLAEEIYVTHIPGDYECDLFFPVNELKEKFEVKSTHKIDDKLSYTIYTRKQ